VQKNRLAFLVMSALLLIVFIYTVNLSSGYIKINQKHQSQLAYLKYLTERAFSRQWHLLTDINEYLDKINQSNGIKQDLVIYIRGASKSKIGVEGLFELVSFAPTEINSKDIKNIYLSINKIIYNAADIDISDESDKKIAYLRSDFERLTNLINVESKNSFTYYLYKADLNKPQNLRKLKEKQLEINSLINEIESLF